MRKDEDLPFDWVVGGLGGGKERGQWWGGGGEDHMEGRGGEGM